MSQQLKILAVDISGLFSQYWEVGQGRERDFDKPRLSTLAAVRRFREGHDRVAICTDSGKSFRTLLWPSYKDNRTDRGEAYRHQIALTIESLEAEGCSVFRAPKYRGDLYAEADDVIGSLCNWAHESGHTVTVLSSDKDLFQLVAEHVRVLRPLEKDAQIYGPAEVEAKIGLPPHLVPHWLALAGDRSDNFKPYPGIGDKFAIALVRKYGHALGVFDGVVSMPELNDILGAKLAESFVAAGSGPATKCLDVASIARDLPLDFERLTGEPVMTTPDMDSATEETPSMEPVALAPMPAAPTQPAQSQPAPTTAVAPMSAHFNSPYWMQPDFVRQIWRISEAFFQAKLFPAFANPQQIMTVGMMAYEDGVGIATALQHAYPVHGRLCWSATYLLMRAEASGTVETFDVTSSTEKECVIKCKRRGRAEKIVRFTLDDAKRAQIVKAGGNWDKWPTEMLLARCIARALRQEWRDKVGGRYVPEEMDAPLSDDAVIEQAREVRRALAEPKPAQGGNQSM